MRTAPRFGVTAHPPDVDMTKVRGYVRQAIERVYQFESPEELRKQGIEVIQGARFDLSMPEQSWLASSSSVRNGFCSRRARTLRFRRLAD